ncbi:VOC family protein [Catalinimonas niigatensis]|uniref:hypothetical protein n=1 Tax=Catalinimonas niigatensis TaxID=1397264 RepID=UPI0026663C7A|nr:hypothetical protein [Catalinimonas niigatensis]WPP52774.1 hypothetical protein PZB72_10335 [Catalinimonas niigatensis]
MHFTKLVPNVFYADIRDGLSLFVDCLQFSIGHDERHAEHPFCVLEKNELHINLFQDPALAKEHQPEFRLVTNDIEEVYQTIASSHTEFLHPNLSTITLRPWGAKEFALRDKQVCIVIQQW